MSKQHDSQDQQRRQAARRYIDALERSNIATVAAILSEAEHDLALESLLLKANQQLQAREGIAAQGGELLQARRFLSALRDEARIGANPESLSSSGSSSLPTAGNNGTFHERRLQPMQIETPSTPPKTVLKREAAPRKTRFPRAARFMQATAAVLLVSVLIAGFIFAFAMRRGVPGQGKTGGQGTPQPVVSVLSQNGFVYGLNPSQGTINWEFNMHSSTIGIGSFDVGSLIVQNQVVYAYNQSQGQLYALKSNNGHLLWKTKLGAPYSGTGAGIVLDRGILFINSTDQSLHNVLYAVRIKDGKILWHDTTGISEGLAASNGIVYVGMENDPFHPLLLALRGTDGKELWSYTAYPVSIAVVNSVVYVYSAHVQTPTDNGGNKQYKPLLALNARNGTLIWSKQTINDGISSLEIGNGLIVLALIPKPNTYRLCAYRSMDGVQQWCTKSVPPLAANVTASSVMTGMIVVTYPSHMQNPFTEVEALDLQNGNVLWSKHLSGISNGLMATIQGIAYIAFDIDNSNLYALNSSNGHTLWHTHVGDVVAIAAGS